MVTDPDPAPPAYKNRQRLISLIKKTKKCLRKYGEIFQTMFTAYLTLQDICRKKNIRQDLKGKSHTSLNNFKERLFFSGPGPAPPKSWPSDMQKNLKKVISCFQQKRVILLKYAWVQFLG